MKARRLDVVVVDDDLDLADAIALALQPACAVRVANEASHALLELRRREPDCLLSDYRLGGVTSATFLSSVAEAWPRTRRILMTGSPRSTIQPLLDTGIVHAWLRKPVDVEVLLACIRGLETPGALITGADRTSVVVGPRRTLAVRSNDDEGPGTAHGIPRRLV